MFVALLSVHVPIARDGEKFQNMAAAGGEFQLIVSGGRLVFQTSSFLSLSQRVSLIGLAE